VLETDFGRELARELKHARELAKKNIQSAQKTQKQCYDRGVKEVGLQVGDLVMLKVEPRFRLDRTYKGLFKIKSLTSTNAVIALKDNDNVDAMNVSRQRLSKCRPEMLQATPWVGHSGRLNKRKQVKRKQQRITQEKPVVSLPEAMSDLSDSTQLTTTRSGRRVKPLARFQMILRPRGSVRKEGGSCRAHSDNEYLEQRQEQGSVMKNAEVASCQKRH